MLTRRNSEGKTTANPQQLQVYSKASMGKDGNSPSSEAVIQNIRKLHRLHLPTEQSDKDARWKQGKRVFCLFKVPLRSSDIPVRTT